MHIYIVIFMFIMTVIYVYTKLLLNKHNCIDEYINKQTDMGYISLV